MNLSYPSYDNANNILTQVENGVTKTFNYDNINQLLGVNVGGVQTEQFTYDPVGNRLTSIDNPSWTYNTDNELTGYGVTSMTYDANGNMTGWSDSSGSHNLSYDFENRLASYTTASTTASYLYDPQGRRLQKKVNGVVTRYLWDGATMIAELDGTNQVQGIYTYNPQSMEPVSTAIGCTAYFYITDHLMTPQMLTSISGTTVWYAQYTAFGTATLITDTVTNNLRFPGQYADAESGLYYNYHRYYLPQAGRYAEIDPFNTSAIFTIFSPILISTPRILHEYLYVLNNPLKFVDIDGLYVGSVGGFIGGGIPGASGSCTVAYAHDQYGNKGIVVCCGGGPSTNDSVGASGGVFGGNDWGAKDLCDMEGPGAYFSGGGGAGLGGYGGYNSGGGIDVGLGWGFGGWTADVGGGGCKVFPLWGTPPCKKKHSCPNK